MGESVVIRRTVAGLATDFKGGSSSESHRDSQKSAADDLFADTRFEEGAALEETAPLQPASLPLLFFQPEDRRYGTQPESFANNVRGIRNTPRVCKTVDYGGKFISGNSTIRAGKDALHIVGSMNQAVRVGLIDCRTGASGDIDATGLDGETLCHLVASFDDGVVVGGSHTNPKSRTVSGFVSKIDAQTRGRLWTAEFDIKTFDKVEWLHVTPSGDVFVICKLKPARNTSSDMVALLDASTGEVKCKEFQGFSYQLGCRSEYVERRGQVEGKSVARRQPLWVGDDKAIFGLDSNDQRDSHYVSLRSVDFATCKFENQSVITVQHKGQSVTLLENGKGLFSHQNIEACEGFEFDAKGQFTQRPFDRRSIFKVGSQHAMVNNKTHGVGVVPEGLAFFVIKNAGFDEIVHITIDDFDSRKVTDLAMTADNVAYVSRVLSEQVSQPHSVSLNCRLSAYDSTTGKELWSVEETFENEARVGNNTPKVIVNSDGSIAWMGNNHGLIYK